MRADYDTAQGYFAESLKLAWETGDQPNVAYDLTLLGAVATGLRHYSRAVRLWGAAEVIRAAMGIVGGRAELRLYEQALSAARTAVDEAAFRDAWEAGGRMTVEEAVVYALEADVTQFE
jgi:hypothetical protein